MPLVHRGLSATKGRAESNSSEIRNVRGSNNWECGRMPPAVVGIAGQSLAPHPQPRPPIAHQEYLRRRHMCVTMLWLC